MLVGGQGLHRKEHFFGGGNTWARQHTPVVDMLNLICKGLAAVLHLATSTYLLLRTA